VTGLTRDLNGIVTGGWRGAAAEQALGALAPIDQWSASQTDIAQRTTTLMDSSGTATAQTKTMMPTPVSHDWRESLTSFAVGGVPGVVIDAVAQEKAQSNAREEAVRVMTNVYSAALNDYRAGIPTYQQLADPTMVQPDPSPISGPAPSTGHMGGGGAGGNVTGAVGDGGSGAGAYGAAHHVSAPSAPATLQGVTSNGGASVPSGVDHMMPVQPTRQGQHTAGQVAAEVAAAAGVPIMAPVAASIARSVRSSGAGIPCGGGGRLGAGHITGHAAGQVAEFGPRPTTAVEAAEGRMSGSPGNGATGAARTRVGMNAMPMAPVSAGSGRGRDDSEHQRPSYLIEMDDVFTDGRKVAPAVIGEDPPASER
jgi:hypothetical protein